MIPATTSMTDAQNRVWNAIVVGAGPAGSVAALGIARRGLRVLLVDRAEFPRHKLCGACLNGDAIAGLRELGLAERFEQLGGVALNEFRLQTSGKTLSLELPGGVAVTRRRFDAMLIEAAIDAGADFLPGVRLELQPASPDDAVRRLTTTGRAVDSPLCAEVVVLASGLAADRRPADPALAVVAETASRIGVGTTTTQFPDDYTPGTIFMAVGQAGYVGLSRTDGGELNIAAALDHKAVQSGSPRGVCEQILAEAGFPVTSEMLSGEWRGTIGLTRHRQAPASTRLLVVGDAAGYVEPFTGEGMAWAIRGAQVVVPFVERALKAWNPDIIDEWSKTSQQLIGRRQRWCRLLARILRHPFMVRGLVRIVAAIPSLGQAVIRRLNKEHNNEVLDSRTRHSSAA